MMNTTLNSRSGFALPAALLAMVVIGAVVTGGFYAANQENQISAATAGSRDAFYVADLGIQNTLGTNFRPDYQAVPLGQERASSGWATIGTDTLGRYDVTIRHLDQELFLISSTGQLVNRGRYVGARRKVAQVVRTELWDMPMGAALNVYGGLRVSGSSYIDGIDADGGTCQPQGDAVVAGVNTANGSNVTVQGGGQIVGDPAVKSDPSMNAGTLLNYGDVDFNKLAAMASLIVPESNPPNTWPSISAGKCNISDRFNWGEPRVANHPHVCQTYMPIIYSTASTLRLQGGVGQGILLVEGDLKASGGFTFHGIIIVKGKLETSGTGAHFNGVVVVNSDSVSLASTNSSATGNSIIKFSSCSAAAAMSSHIRAVPIASRSWFDFTNVGAY